MVLRRFGALLVCALLAAACGDTGDDTAGSVVIEACQLADDYGDCPACESGVVTCTYGETSVSRNSCGDCQARAALYRELCDLGVSDSADAILAGAECSDPVPDEG